MKVEQIRMQVGFQTTDIVGYFFFCLAGEIKAPVEIVVRECERSLDRLSMLICDNKMIACVIERRTEFNDLEFTLIQL